MTNDVINNAINIYSDSIIKHGVESFESLHWGNKERVLIRYQMILDKIKLDENISILDVGCGNGSFFEYLKTKGFKGKYTGFDINKEFIEIANKKYLTQNCKFYQKNILDENNINNKYDYVISCGVFNLNYGQDFIYIKEYLVELFKIANKKVIFNAISSYTNFKDDKMFYLNPLETLDFIIRKLSPNVILEHGKLPYNFQVIIEKEQLND